jgi:hypothetical protein
MRLDDTWLPSGKLPAFGFQSGKLPGFGWRYGVVRGEERGLHFNEIALLELHCVICLRRHMADHTAMPSPVSPCWATNESSYAFCGSFKKPEWMVLWLATEEKLQRVRESHESHLLTEMQVGNATPFSSFLPLKFFAAALQHTPSYTPFTSAEGRFRHAKSVPHHCSSEHLPIHAPLLNPEAGIDKECITGNAAFGVYSSMCLSPREHRSTFLAPGLMADKTAASAPAASLIQQIEYVN